jgi:MYXO-CTERM domain-containing protein
LSSSQSQGGYHNAITAVVLSSPTLGTLALSVFDTSGIVIDDFPVANPSAARDSYRANANGSSLPGPITGFAFEWYDSTRSVFASDALPLSQPDPSQFDAKHYTRLNLTSGQTCEEDGYPWDGCSSLDLSDIRSVQPTAVPEPASLTWAAASGLLALVGAAMHRRRQS